jgi:uncharacterized membrane protein
VFPWVYRGGVLTRLPLPAGASTGFAAGVNAKGDIVGGATWTATSTAGGPTSRPIRWPADRPGEVALLEAPAQLTVAQLITDDGTVVGRIEIPGAFQSGDVVAGDQRAYLWAPDGSGRYPEPAGASPVIAIEMIRGDWAVGTYRPDDPGRRVQSFRWNRRTGEVLHLPEFYPHSVDLTGRMLGSSAGPAVWEDGQVRTLPTLPPAQSGWVLFASADSRTAIGRLQETPDKPQTAVVWHC